MIILCVILFVIILVLLIYFAIEVMKIKNMMVVMWDMMISESTHTDSAKQKNREFWYAYHGLDPFANKECVDPRKLKDD